MLSINNNAPDVTLTFSSYITKYSRLLGLLKVGEGSRGDQNGC